MEIKAECVNIELYQARFNEYYKCAKRLPKECSSMQMLEGQLSLIGAKAGGFFNQNRNDNQPDHQVRINIFLNFDEYLKQLKREFNLSLGKKTSSCKFFDKNSLKSSGKKGKKLIDTLHF